MQARESGVGQLRRLLGLGFGLAVIVGSTIGVGILRTPGLVAGHLPSSAAILVLWLVGGLYTLLGAVCLSELGTMAPQAGGYYTYARRGFGDWVGFGVGWTDWLTYCTVLAYASISLAEFTGGLVPALGGWVRPIAAGTLLAMVALQWAGLKVSARFQEWTTTVKFLAFLALIVAAFTMTPAGAPGLRSLGEGGGFTFAGVILALQAVVIAYGGWQARGARAGVVVVVANVAVAAVLVGTSTAPDATWVDFVRAGTPCVWIFGGFATLTLAAIALWGSPIHEYRLLATVIVLGPLTLIRPIVILAGLAIAAARASDPRVWIMAALAGATVLGIEGLLGRAHAARWRQLVE